jgi:hypothetical protein
MFEPIASVFNYLTHVPLNFWVWLLPVAAPLLVFCIKPDKKWGLRIGRLLLAIGMTYVLMNLALHTGRTIKWNVYEACQSQFSDGAIQRHEECGEINIADGASNVFYAYFGWIPAMAYVGIWEALWRIRHRRKIKEMGKEYKGKWISNIIIGFAIFLFVIYPACMAIAWVIVSVLL